jgi:hypothetical protein
MYIRTTEYYSTLKKKGHSATWMTLEDIMLSEVSQSQKKRQILQDFTSTRYLEKSDAQSVIARDWGKGKVETLFKGVIISVLQN